MPPITFWVKDGKVTIEVGLIIGAQQMPDGRCVVTLQGDDKLVVHEEFYHCVDRITALGGL